MAIGVPMMAGPASKLYPVVGPRKMMIIAFFGQMVLTMALALIDYDTNDLWIAANMFARGLFFAFLIISIQAATFATIRP
jgi:hypothetical protein